jgi:sporulation protein YlmC with PRC-barrel domain
MIVEAGKSLGVKVLDFDSGGVLAVLNWPIVNPDTGILEAFWVKPLNLALRNAVLQVADIVEFKKNVYIKSEEVMADPADVIRLSEILSEGRPILGALVMNEAGVRYGKVVDLSFSTETYMLKQIVVEKTFLGIFQASSRIFGWGQILQITEKGIIVDDSNEAKEPSMGDMVEPAAG